MRPGAAPSEPLRPISSRVVLYSAGVIALFVAIGALFYYLLDRLTKIPLSAVDLVRLAIVAALGLAVLYAINALLRSLVSRAWGDRRAGLVCALFRMVGYVVLAVALLLTAGVSGLSLLAGGTFAGLVIGLAGQQVLSNLFAGLVILIARPYEIGERVTISTWQYGMTVPTYPPKFYSQDFLIPGYTGTVRDVGIFYTYLDADDGTSIRMPNSILVQASVISHEVAGRSVRTKYEIVAPVLALDPQVVLDAVRTAVRANDWVARPESVNVMINQATATTYVLTIDAYCRGSLEEPARSAILLTVMRTVRGLAPGAPRSA
jgi:small conductance mechanosensitive channel